MHIGTPLELSAQDVQFLTIGQVKQILFPLLYFPVGHRLRAVHIPLLI